MSNVLFCKSDYKGMVKRFLNTFSWGDLFRFQNMLKVNFAILRCFCRLNYHNYVTKPIIKFKWCSVLLVENSPSALKRKRTDIYKLSSVIGHDVILSYILWKRNSFVFLKLPYTFRGVSCPSDARHL